MRFVTTNSGAQFSLQSVHRYRLRLVGNSTQLVNQAGRFLIAWRCPPKEGIFTQSQKRVWLVRN